MFKDFFLKDIGDFLISEYFFILKIFSKLPIFLAYSEIHLPKLTQPFGIFKSNQNLKERSSGNVSPS